jgi:hypothetical protein
MACMLKILQEGSTELCYKWLEVWENTNILPYVNKVTMSEHSAALWYVLIESLVSNTYQKHKFRIKKLRSFIMEYC